METSVIYITLLMLLGHAGNISAVCLYGDDDICAFPCRCTQGCDRTTGACLNGGGCELDQVWGEWYYGHLCQVGNIALNKRANHGGSYGGYGADLAVDGDINPDLSAGHCSYTYTTGSQAWWYLDLGGIHYVERVKLYNVRFQEEGFAVDTLSQLRIRIGNDTSSTSSTLVDCFYIGNNSIGSAGSREFTCNTTVYGRYVHIIRDYISSSYTRLILCEVVVIGWKVIDCSSCGSGESCTAYDGCKSCPDGKMYPDCKEDCPRGTFGQGCEKNCASATMSHCKEGNSCHPRTGNPVDCSDGCQGGDQYGTWRFGSTCTKSLGQVLFGSSDAVEVLPINVTSTSLTWRWKESTQVPPVAVDVVGYQVYYWYNSIRYLGVDQYYTWTEWQTATVTGLTPGTEYQFNISVYRQWQGREKFVGSYWAYSATVNSPLVALTSACDRGLYGQNCEKECSAHCSEGTDCDPVTGTTGTCEAGCAGGLEGQVWWYGENCAISLGVMQFGLSDIVDTNPASVTSTSVTWRWKESTSVPVEAVGDVGYYLYYRLTTSLTWIRGAAAAFIDAEWQEGTVNNLQPGTMYQFDISVYRRWEGGDIQEHRNRARDHAAGGKDLSATTLADSSSTRKPTTATTTIAPSTVLIITSDMSSIDSSSGIPGTVKPSPPPSQSVITSRLHTSSASISSIPSTVSFPSVSTTLKNNDSPTPSMTTRSISSSTKTATSSDSSTPATVSPLGFQGDGTSIGVIAGASVGALLLILISGTLIFIFIRLRRKEHELSNEGIDEELLNIDKIEAKSQENDNLESPRDDPVCGSPIVTEEENESDELDKADATVHISSVSISIHLRDLKNHVLRNIANNRAGFRDEYEKIPTGKLKDCDVGSSPENVKKNRFKNIFAYDENRVVLEENNGSLIDTDYINASHIQNDEEPSRSYVATQGPTKHTLSHIWAMMWQLKSNRIVMLSKNVENAVRKCEVYWPATVGDVEEYDEFKIRNISTENYTNYTLRVFSMKRGDENRTIKHLQFLQWPDKSVPEQALPLLSFRRKVRSFDKIGTGPTVVHCSAGVGRTGTFIALDILLEQVDRCDQVDVMQLVSKLRHQRMFMVQTFAQYVFVYEALVDAVTSGHTSVSCDQFCQMVANLKQADSKLAKQFQTLNDLRPLIDPSAYRGSSEENKDKNRMSDIVPRDDERAYLNTKWEAGNDYINAVYINGYTKENSLIVTQMPLTGTIIDFWRLVHDHKVELILTLENVDEDCPLFWPDAAEITQQYGPIEVTLFSREERGTLTIREFKIKLCERPESEFKTVTQYHAADWSGEIPSLGIILELLGVMEEVKQNDQAKTIIQCRDGASRCGLLCVSSFLVESIKVDQEVDVFTATRHMYARRPQFIPNKEQFCFLHQVAGDYITQYDMYANFQ